jgi:hypothetical protein
VGGRLLGGDAAFVDEALHEGVVVGDLVQLVAAQQVGTGVADVDEPEALSGGQEGGERRAHALQRAVGGDHVAEVSVGGLDRLAQRADQVAAREVVVERGHGLDRHAAGDLARRVATHAVRDREQPRAGVHRVLVARAEQSDVAARAEPQPQAHRRSSSTVFPTRICAPSATGTGSVTRCRPR